MNAPGPVEGLNLSGSLASLAWVERVWSLPWIFGLLGASAFFIAWNRGIALLFALFALWVGAALFSLLGPRLMVRAARLRFGLPEQASVGDRIQVQVGLLPLAWPNTRHLLLLKSPYPFAPREEVFLSVAGRRVVRHQEVLCTQRGLFRGWDVEVASGYPLGLLTLQRRWAAESGGIMVYPRVYPGTGFTLPPSSARSWADLEAPSPALWRELFRDVREYQRGDDPRHIHWRSSARHGKWVVKRFDAVTTHETWIVLDLDPTHHRGLGEDHTFERSLEIAASLATQWIRAGFRCGLAGGQGKDGQPALLFAPGSGSAHLQILLDALAAVRAECSVPYAEVLAALARHHRPGQQWVLFQHAERRFEASVFFRGQGAPFWFRFDGASFQEPASEQRDLVPPERQSDGVLVGRDTDYSAIFA